MCGACAGGGADDLKVALLRALMLSNQSKHCYRRVRAAEGRKRGRKARRDARHHHGRCGPPAWARGWLKAAAAPADRRLRLARRRGSREGHVGYVFWAGGGQSRPCATVLRDLVGPSILSKSHQNRDRSEIVSRPRATSARPQPHRGIRQRGQSWGSCAERLVGARGAHALIVQIEESGLGVKRSIL